MENKTTERPVYVNALLDEIDGMDESLFPPTAELEDGDKLIGIVEGWPRKVLALGRYYGREKERLQVEMKYDEQNGELSRRYGLMRDTHDLLLEMFWWSVRTQLKVGLVGIGVRTGWRIVASPRRTDPEELLRRLLGQ